MIDRLSNIDCVQCGNCVNVCPTQAISFSNSDELFEYPIINYEICIDCEKCEKVCPAINILNQDNIIASYAAYNKDSNVLKNSSSGGIFTSLARYIIQIGGIVYGAAFVNSFEVSHIRVDNLEDLNKLRGSKYVLSNLNSSFNEIKKELINHSTILFVGAPCQCSALRVYLSNISYSGTLYNVDFVCHGILSDKLFFSYIEYLESKHNSKIIEFKFRDKKYGWAESGPMIKYDDGKVERWPLSEDLYMQGYFKAICMRESCYKCQYKNFHSGSDLTMGDYWGAEFLSPDFYNKDGMSILIVNNKTGLELFNRINSLLAYKKVPIKKLTTYNQGLYKPFPKGQLSQEFYRLLEDNDAITALQTVSKISLKEKVLRLYRSIRRKIKYKIAK